MWLHAYWTHSLLATTFGAPFPSQNIKGCIGGSGYFLCPLSGFMSVWMTRFIYGINTTHARVMYCTPFPVQRVKDRDHVNRSKILQYPLRDTVSIRPICTKFGTNINHKVTMWHVPFLGQGSRQVTHVQSKYLPAVAERSRSYWIPRSTCISVGVEILGESNDA